MMSTWQHRLELHHLDMKVELVQFHFHLDTEVEVVYH
mgnify:CR=1 FL=1